MTTINERVKHLRKTLKLNQQEFGMKLGLSRSGVQKLEGESDPRQTSIRAICEKFHVSRAWLVDGIEPMYIPSTDDTAELLDEKFATGDRFTKALLRTIAHMDNDQLAAVEEFFYKLQANVNEKPEDE